jgi:FkbM family methyltransferase
MNDAARRLLLLIIIGCICILIFMYSEQVKKDELKRIVEEAVEKRMRTKVCKTTITTTMSITVVPTPSTLRGEIVPWDFSRPFRLPGEACSLVPITPPSFLEPIQKFTQCIRRNLDVVSNEIRSLKRWRGCDNPLQLLSEYVDPKGSTIFLDVGANIGSCSLLALATGATVIAFEPLPANLYYFHESIASLNPQWKNRLTLWPVALGAIKKEETIYTEPGNAGNSALEFPTRAKRDNSKVVSVIPLDDILKDIIHLNNNFVMKMDVQGYELHVLEGAKRLLESKRIKVIQTEISTEWLKNLGKKPSDMCAFLWEAGFDIFEEACVGTGRNSVQRGRGLTEKKCKEWDTLNAECDVVARLKT